MSSRSGLRHANVVVADRVSLFRRLTYFRRCSRLLAKRIRRAKWEAAGVFSGSSSEGIDAYDTMIGFDLFEVAVDKSRQKVTARSATVWLKLGLAVTLLTTKPID